MSNEDLPVVRQVLALLHKDKLGDADAALQLRRYVVVFALECVSHPITKTVSWEHLVAAPDMVFSVDHLVDIGAQVRGLFLIRQDELNGKVMSSADAKPKTYQHAKRGCLMQYVLYCSLPRIKHSRVQFPMNATWYDAMQLIQITFAMLLGIIPGAGMQPTWRIHVLLTVYMLDLTSKPHVELLTWCQQNFSVIRLALLEYYMYFVSTHMPVEYGQQIYLFYDSHAQPSDVCCICEVRDSNTAAECVCTEQSDVFGEINDNLRRHVVIAIDQVRQLTLQGTGIDWNRIRERCTMAIDKCNRVTRNKRCQWSSFVTSSNFIGDVHEPQACAPIPDVDNLSQDEIEACMEQPMTVHHPFYSRQMLSLSVREALVMMHMNRIINVFMLPPIIRKKQERSMQIRRQALGVMEKIRSRYYLCVYCVMRNCKSEHRVFLPCVGGQPDDLVSDSMHVLCMTCKNSKTMTYVDLTGRILRLYNVWYYLCLHCQTVHQYKGEGVEFVASVHCQLNQYCCYHFNNMASHTRHKSCVKRHYMHNKEQTHAAAPTSVTVRQHLYSLLNIKSMTSRVYTVLETSDDTFNTAQSQQRRVQHTKCLLCDKSFQLKVFCVLDDRLGVMQTIALCSRHSPYTHQMKMVYNICTMVSAIKSKEASRGFRM